MPRIVIIILAVLLVTATQPVAASQDESSLPSRFVGFATTTVDQGNTGVFGADVVVTLTLPTTGEANPFRLVIAPVSDTTSAGGISVVSVSEPGKLGQVVQYWTIRADGDTVFHGDLTGNASTANTITLSVARNDIQLLPMEVGSSLTGRFSEAGLTLWIEGTTVVGNHTFETAIEATIAETAEESALPAGQRGIINTNSVEMFERPDPVSPVIATLSAGTVVTITGPSVAVFLVGNYLPITLEDGRSGWVYEPFVDRVGEPADPVIGDPGEIIGDGIPLLGSPSTFGAVVATLDTGTLVTITGPSVRDLTFDVVYVPVALEDGMSGWVNDLFVRRL